jgi:hypothetical protein
MAGRPVAEVRAELERELRARDAYDPDDADMLDKLAAAISAGRWGMARLLWGTLKDLAGAWTMLFRGGRSTPRWLLEPDGAHGSGPDVLRATIEGDQTVLRRIVEDYSWQPDQDDDEYDDSEAEEADDEEAQEWRNDGGSADFTAWLKHEPTAATPNRIVVYAGKQPIGALSAVDAAQVIADVRAMQRRGVYRYADAIVVADPETGRYRLKLRVRLSGQA